jgi:predicted Fe-S protein YdhL (DUF1289 family)
MRRLEEVDKTFSHLCARKNAARSKWLHAPDDEREHALSAYKDASDKCDIYFKTYEATVIKQTTTRKAA